MIHKTCSINYGHLADLQKFATDLNRKNFHLIKYLLATFIFFLSFQSVLVINLHWLPIQYRTQFKLLLLIYKFLHGVAPNCLSDKLSLRPSKGLRVRSDNQLLLNVPFSTAGLSFMGVKLSRLPGPYSEMHYLRPFGCVPYCQRFKAYLFKTPHKVWLC